MNIEARKYQLIEQVMQFDDNDVKKIECFLKSESSLSSSLDRALQQVKDGKVIPHDQVKGKYKKWL